MTKIIWKLHAYSASDARVVEHRQGQQAGQADAAALQGRPPGLRSRLPYIGRKLPPATRASVPSTPDRTGTQPAVTVRPTMGPPPAPTTSMHGSVRLVYAAGKPPIESLSGRQIDDALARFSASVADWQPGQGSVGVTTAPVTGAAAPAGIDWDARLGMTRTMALQMMGKDYGGRTVLAYQVEDRSGSATAGAQRAPIALMAVSTVVEPWSFEPKNFVEIESIVGHPGFKGAGGALIEHAATLSQSLGHGGAVRLTPLQDDNAQAAYAALGFRPCSGTGKEWELVPSSRPDKWVLRQDEWRLRKNVDQQYLSRMQ